jgi:hypothetical protein
VRHLIYILLYLALILTSCVNTVGHLDLKGKVVDDSTQAPIANISVMVQAMQQFEDSTHYIYLGDFTTDSIGSFTFTLNKIRDVSIYNFCIEGNPDYDPSDQVLGLSDLHSYAKFLTFGIKRIADFSININRVSNTTYGDTLVVAWLSNGVYGPEMYPYKIENYHINSGHGLVWIGKDIKSAVKTKVYADKYTILHWELFRRGKHTDIIDTVFCRRNVANSVTFTY